MDYPLLHSSLVWREVLHQEKLVVMCATHFNSVVNCVVTSAVTSVYHCYYYYKPPEHNQV